MAGKPYYTLVIEAPFMTTHTNSSAHGRFSSYARALAEKTWLSNRRPDLIVRVEEIRPATLTAVAELWPVAK